MLANGNVQFVETWACSDHHENVLSVILDGRF
jgi:hypothetical protein